MNIEAFSLQYAEFEELAKKIADRYIEKSNETNRLKYDRFIIYTNSDMIEILMFDTTSEYVETESLHMHFLDIPRWERVVDMIAECENRKTETQPK